ADAPKPTEEQIKTAVKAASSGRLIAIIKKSISLEEDKIEKLGDALREKYYDKDHALVYTDLVGGKHWLYIIGRLVPRDRDGNVVGQPEEKEEGQPKQKGTGFGETKPGIPGPIIVTIERYIGIEKQGWPHIVTVEKEGNKIVGHTDVAYVFKGGKIIEQKQFEDGTLEIKVKYDLFRSETYRINPDGSVEMYNNNLKKYVLVNLEQTQEISLIEKQEKTNTMPEIISKLEIKKYLGTSYFEKQSDGMLKPIPEEEGRKRIAIK
ncbi:MAG: hypothetical protein ACPL06_04200, partial [Candidatus Anstonellales archaeon]